MRIEVLAIAIAGIVRTHVILVPWSLSCVVGVVTVLRRVLLVGVGVAIRFDVTVRPRIALTM